MSCLGAGAESAARAYLEVVYRQKPSDAVRATAVAASLEWLYRAPLPSTELCEAVPIDCVTTYLNRSCKGFLDRHAGRVGMLLYGGAPALQPHGFVNAAPKGGTGYTCDSQPTVGDYPTASFTPDYSNIEVLRLRQLGAMEGGGVGCWWFGITGTGVFLPTGRSLRVRNRSELATALGINMTLHTLTSERGPQVRAAGRGWPLQLVTAELRSAYFARWPWVLDHRAGHEICPRAKALGYDTIQLRWEQCSWRDTQQGFCPLEVISCHEACTRAKARSLHEVACPVGLPLRTGWNATLECHCNPAATLANCEGTAPELPPPTTFTTTSHHSQHSDLRKMFGSGPPRCSHAPSSSGPISHIDASAPAATVLVPASAGLLALPTLAAVEAKNGPFRNAVGASTDGWITADILRSRVLEYGLGRYKLSTRAARLREPLSGTPVQADVLAWVGRRIEAAHTGRSLVYMEMGVATLKCFDTMVHFFSHAVLVAVDAEDPNWTRARLWGNATIDVQWAASGPRRTKGREHNLIYRWPAAPNENVVRYAAGDLYDNRTLAAVEQQLRLNRSLPTLIFADAAHTAQAVMAEFVELLRTGLLFPAAPVDASAAMQCQGFAYLWDDCDVVNTKILTAFRNTIVPTLAAAVAKACPSLVTMWSATFRVPGLYGTRYWQDTCLVTTLDVLPGLEAELSASSLNETRVNFRMHAHRLSRAKPVQLGHRQRVRR